MKRVMAIDPKLRCLIPSQVHNRKKVIVYHPSIALSSKLCHFQNIEFVHNKNNLECDLLIVDNVQDLPLDLFLKDLLPVSTIANIICIGPMCPINHFIHQMQLTNEHV